MPTLFDPIKLGAIDAPNRIVMAPLTRGRSTKEHVPTEIMQTYYSQRATAGLLITEATGISREGLGWPYAPGLWTDEQVAAWRPVTDAVHAAGGRIVAQLWHMGRIVHSSFLGGELPVSASATQAPYKAHTYVGRQEYDVARPLEVAEIPRLLADYAHAARNAIAAGFDGVQLHAANGYLIDQFLRNGSNLRDDEYGVTIDGRIRLLDEVVQTLIDTVGADKVGVRLSPNGDSQGVDDSDPEPLFTAAAAMLDKHGIAFLELREPDENGTFGNTTVPRLSPAIRKVFTGPLILNSDYTLDQAQAAIASGVADAISFGRPFISNPDLPERLANGAALAPDNQATWYSQGPEGYIDYPTAA